jgi:hypothetical protein
MTPNHIMAFWGAWTLLCLWNVSRANGTSGRMKFRKVNR